MYYRVAIQVEQAPHWQWKSTLLSEFSALFQWLRLYRALPQDRLRVFSCSSKEGMIEQLMQVNQGWESISVTAEQFLHERRITQQGARWEASAQGTRKNERPTSIAVVTEPSLGESSRELPSLDERGVSFLEKRRVEFERGAGGDHDLPYRFTLPIAMPQVLAWVKLLARVQHADIQPEIVRGERPNSHMQVV